MWIWPLYLHVNQKYDDDVDDDDDDDVEWPKLHRVLAILSAKGLKEKYFSSRSNYLTLRVGLQKVTKPGNTATGKRRF